MLLPCSAFDFSVSNVKYPVYIANIIEYSQILKLKACDMHLCSKIFISCRILMKVLMRVGPAWIKYDKQDQQGMAAFNERLNATAFNERNPHMTQQQEPICLST
jgi:hypothetical protein